MSARLEIFHDGDLVASARVTRKREVWDAMRANPPRRARGGVVKLTDDRGSDVLAISCHSINGPRWATL